jgi:hypothetical protein
MGPKPLFSYPWPDLAAATHPSLSGDRRVVSPRLYEVRCWLLDESPPRAPSVSQARLDVSGCSRQRGLSATPPPRGLDQRHHRNRNSPDGRTSVAAIDIDQPWWFQKWAGVRAVRRATRPSMCDPRAAYWEGSIMTQGLACWVTQLKGLAALSIALLMRPSERTQSIYATRTT